MIHTQVESNSVSLNQTLLFQGEESMPCSLFQILVLLNYSKPPFVFQILNNTEWNKRLRRAVERTGCMILGEWFQQEAILLTRDIVGQCLETVWFIITGKQDRRWGHLTGRGSTSHNVKYSLHNRIIRLNCQQY